MKHISVCALTVLVIAAVVSAGSVSFLGPCIHEDGSVGACHWASRMLCGVGVLLACESLPVLFARGSGMRQGGYLCMFLTSVLGFLTPGTIIGLCRMATMRCHAVMQPAMRILFVLAAVCSLTGFLYERRKAGKP